MRGPNGSWSQNRDLREQRAFRLHVGDRAGWQCQFIVRPDVEQVEQFIPFRCLEDRPRFLEAHHLPDGSGVLLCRAHHRREDAHARG